MQEYFSASSLSEHISVKEFLLISKDPFYWNTCKLIIGALSKQNNNSLIKRLLHSISSDESDNALRYHYFRYILIAECNKNLIQELIGEKELDNLIDFLEQSYLDENWGIVILDIIKKLYAKLHQDKKKYLKLLVEARLDKLLIANHQTRAGAVNSYVILELSNALKLYQDRDFISTTFEKLENLILQLQESIKKSRNYEIPEDLEESFHIAGSFTREEQELNQIIFILFTLLNRVAPSELSRYDFLLERFYNWLPINLKEEVARIMASYQTNEFLVTEITRQNNLVQQLPSSPYNIFYYGERMSIKPKAHEKVVDYPQSIIDLVYSLFKYFIKNETVHSNHTALINTSLSNFDKNYLNPLFDDRDEDIPIITDLLLQGMAALKNDGNIYDLMYPFFQAADLESRSPEYDLLDHAVFRKTVDTELEKLANNFSEERIHFIVFLLNNTRIGKYSFGRYRSGFSKFVKEYISHEMEAFLTEDFEPEEPPFETIYALMMSPKFEFDRNYSIDIALEKADIFPFFKFYLIPTLFEFKEAIHEEKHINFFRKFLAVSGNKTFLLEILENRGFFKYRSNIPFLLEAFQYIKSELNYDDHIFNDHTAFIIGICSRCMTLIVRSDEYELGDYIELFDTFLSPKPVREFIRAVQKNIV